MSPLLSSSSFQWWPHLPPSNPSSSSSSLTPTNFPSSFTASINMLFALTCLPFHTITYSLSLRVCPNYSVWPHLASCPKYLTCSVPPDVLIPAPVRPGLSPKRSSVFELLLPPALLPVFSSVHRCSHNSFPHLCFHSYWDSSVTSVTFLLPCVAVIKSALCAKYGPAVDDFLRW